MKPIEEIPLSQGCALGGGMAIASYIDNCTPCLHSSTGCGFNFELSGAWAAGNQTGGRYTGYMTPCTCLVEKDVVFGGEEKLYNLLINTPKIFKEVDLIVILTGCTSDIIGDDIERVIRRVTPHMDGIKIIYAETGGFKGPASEGANLVLNAIVKQLVMPPQRKAENTVNVLGGFPYYHPFWYGEMEEIKRTLELLEIRTHLFLPGDCDRERMERMAEASLNVVLSDSIGLPAAKLLQEKCGIPYVYAKNGAPIGADASKDFFMEIAQNLALDMAEVEKKLDKEEEHLYRRLEQAVLLWSAISNMDYGLIAPSGHAIGLVRFLTKELGFYPSVVGLSFPGEESENTLWRYLKEMVPDRDPEIIMDPNTIEIQEALDRAKPRFIFARTVEKEIAIKNNSMFLSIAYPITDRQILCCHYLGYRGALRFVEDMFTAAGGIF